jgi:hypothetical protein
MSYHAGNRGELEGEGRIENRKKKGGGKQKQENEE